MKAVVVLGPVLLLLLVGIRVYPCAEADCCSAPGSSVGSLPAWLFYLTQPDPGQGNIASARRFLVIGVNLSWPLVSEFLVNALSLPIGVVLLRPLHAPPRSPRSCCARGVYLAAVSVAGVDAVRALRGTLPARRAWGLWALLLTLVATFAALYFSGF